MAHGAELLFQIITALEERASIACASNAPFSEWGKTSPTPGSPRPSLTASTKRLFSAEFRVEAAHRVIDSGRTIAEVARELAVGEQLLGRWVRDERIRQAAALAVPDVPDTPVTESERAELVRLRRKVIDQARQFEEQERDVTFLKKASAYFAAMQPK